MTFLRRLLFLVRYHLYAKWILSRTDSCTLFGFRLTIPSGVFHPKLFDSSRLLAKFVESLDLKDKTVLDMGTGSGIIGLCAARKGALVTSADLNPEAVASARANAMSNGMASRMDVLQSDLFDALPNKRFQYILWNPPFFPNTPGNFAEFAWHAGEKYELFDRLAQLSPRHLTPDGVLALLLSTDVDLNAVLEKFRRKGFTIECKRTLRRLFEVVSVYEFRLSQTQ